MDANNSKKPQSGLGITGMVLGILSVFTAAVYVGGALGVLAIIFSAIGMTRKQRGHGTAIAGLVMGIVAMAVVAGNYAGKSLVDSISEANSSEQNTEISSAQGLSGDKNSEEIQKENTIEYISVTADELSEALSDNAMKAQNDYKKKYLEITGKLGNIDSNGKYIDIDSDIDFDFTIIQCYIKSNEQKQIIMEMSRGDHITVKGYCKDIGEILGYSIDIESIEKN